MPRRLLMRIRLSAKRSALAVAALMLSGTVGAQQAAEQATSQRRPFAISPYAAITETLTDNVNLSTKKRSDLITQPSVGVHADADLAWLRGYLDYSLTGLSYARGSAADRFQNSLNAIATAEIVRNRAGVDLAGNISQQAISPFGVRSADTSLNNPNQTSVASFSVSPYLRGRLVGTADYEVRLRYLDSRSNDAPASDFTLSSQALSIADPNPGGQLGWSAQLSHMVVDYDGGVRTEADLLRGVLDWNVTPELRLSAIGGSEANNYVSTDKESHSLWGAGLTWRPSPRTDLALEAERRFFGHSHSALFTHRTARTVWSFADVRDVSTNTTPVFGNLGTAYDIFFRQFASIEPDPILRQQMVNNFLLANGIDPNTTATARFLSSAVTLQRAQNLSFAWLGRRDTVSLSASQTWQQQLSALSGSGGSSTYATQVRQRGLLATLSHRLTPLSAISLSVGHQRTTGLLSTDTSTLRSLSALFTTQLGRRTSLSVGARRAVFDHSSTPYNETAVFGSLRAQF